MKPTSKPQTPKARSAALPTALKFYGLAGTDDLHGFAGTDEVADSEAVLGAPKRRFRRWTLRRPSRTRRVSGA
jgi:hypothetical protein